jgi:hypothetical protein
LEEANKFISKFVEEVTEQTLSSSVVFPVSHFSKILLRILQHPHDNSAGCLQAGYSKDDDTIGIIRRSMMSRTRLEKEEEACALEYMKLPVHTRIATVSPVELANLSSCRLQGLLTADEYQLRSGESLHTCSQFERNCERPQSRLPL